MRPAVDDARRDAPGRRIHGNLWLNTGHGTLGWTMAAGSGRSAEIESADLGYARYLPPVRRGGGVNPALRELMCAGSAKVLRTLD